MIYLLMSTAIAEEPQAVAADVLTSGQKVALGIYCVGFGTGMTLMAASVVPFSKATNLQTQFEDPLAHFTSEAEFNAARDKYGRNRTAFNAMFWAGLGLAVVSPIPIIVSLEVKKDTQTVSVSGRF